MQMPKWIRDLFGLHAPKTNPVPVSEKDQGISRRDVSIGVLACLSAPVVASGKITAGQPSPYSDPYYAKYLPVEEKVAWSKADDCFVWVSKLLGKDEREWDHLSFYVTAGISETDPTVSQKGDRIRMFLCYDSPGGLSIGSIIAAATHKSVYAEPRSQVYAVNSVTGMDAQRRSRLIIASPGPFVVHSVSGKFRVTPAVVERYRREYVDPDGKGNPPGSMPDPEVYGTLFFKRPDPPMEITKVEPVYGGEAEMDNDPYKGNSIGLEELDKLLAEAASEELK